MPSPRHFSPQRLPVSGWALGWLLLLAPAGFSQETDAEPDRSLPSASASRSEAEQDRLTSQTFLLQGRIHARRGEREAALRCYQRAWRYEPAQHWLLTEIVQLSLSLGRRTETLNYAFQLTIREGAEPSFSRTIARQLLETGDELRALQLFQHARHSELQSGKPPRSLVDSLAAEQQLGRLLLIAGRPADAARGFARVRAAFLKSDPPLSDDDRKRIAEGETDLSRRWAEAFSAAGDWDAAEACWQAVTDQTPAGIRAAGLAEVALARRDLPTCRRQLEACFAAENAQLPAAALRVLRNLVVLENPPEKALAALAEELSRLHKAHPEHISVARALGQAQLEAGKSEAGLATLAGLTEKVPDEAAFQLLAGYYHRQQEAESFLKLAGRIVAHSGSLARIGPQVAAAVQDEPFGAALVAAADKIAATAPLPERCHTLFAAALLALGGGQNEAADRLFARSLEGLERAVADRKIDWALQFIDQRPTAAIAVLDSISLDQAPSKRIAAVQFYRAGGLALAGETEAALTAIRQAIVHAPNEPQYQVRLPWILHFAGENAAAEREYAAVVERFGKQYSNSEAVDAVREAALALSTLAAARGDRSTAAEWLERLLDFDPQDIAPLNDLAYLWAEQGICLQRALRMSQAVVAAVPDDAGYRDTHAWVLYKLGRLEQAEQEFAAICAAPEADAVSVDHWGDVLLALGRRSEAVEAFRRAATAFQNEGDSKKSREITRKAAQVTIP